MSVGSFRSVFMVASCAGAALGCYLVSLRVASERAALEGVETRIVLTQRDIRLLQTEIGTRGRLAQLERWNVKVLALSAPSADQFLDGGFALARMVAPQHQVDPQAPVVLASAPANGPKPQIEGAQQDPDVGVSASQMLHMASLKREIPTDQARVELPKLVAPAPSLAAAKPQTIKLALADPLAPQPAKSVAHSTAATHANAKDTGRKQ
ncbi:hypothetical protein [Sphingomonas sp.]|uniref:hypothetical protein n=1 Tax=Sphingomonas sp. TaxID=28214 RepID=UPI00286AEAF7|nr:hypothetical protein [Sphingomonas sp.]